MSLLYFILMCYGLTQLLVYGSIFNKVRPAKGFFGELFILGVILSIIVLISIIPLGVGLLISIPLGIMANTHVYQKLNKQALKTD